MWTISITMIAVRKLSYQCLRVPNQKLVSRITIRREVTRERLDDELQDEKT